MIYDSSERIKAELCTYPLFVVGQGHFCCITELTQSLASKVHTV